MFPKQPLTLQKFYEFMGIDSNDIIMVLASSGGGACFNTSLQEGLKSLLLAVCLLQELNSVMSEDSDRSLLRVL